jgi:hypothetical protein
MTEHTDTGTPVESTADTADEKSEDGSVYDDSNRSELPEWWHSAIAEFRAHDLPPYQPPRFADGVLIHEVIENLEDRHNRRISLLGMDTRYGDDWAVRIGEKTVGEIKHGRAAEGYVVFGLESDEFEEWIDTEMQE